MGAGAVLRERAEPALQQCGLVRRALDDEEPVSATEVSLGTMHRAKGREFKAVVVLGCEEGLLPLTTVMKDIEDDADRDAYLMWSRSANCCTWHVRACGSGC